MNVSNENSKIVLAASRYEYIHYEFIWKKKDYVFYVFEPMGFNFIFISIAKFSTYYL